jgi:hypothetical protein
MLRLAEFGFLFPFKRSIFIRQKFQTNMLSIYSNADNDISIKAAKWAQAVEKLRQPLFSFIFNNSPR